MAGDQVSLLQAQTTASPTVAPGNAPFLQQGHQGANDGFRRAWGLDHAAIGMELLLYRSTRVTPSIWQGVLS